jgi:signal transduction histidine kinase
MMGFVRFRGRWVEVVWMAVALAGTAAVVGLTVFDVRLGSSFLSDRSSRAVAWSLAVALLTVGVVGYLLARARRSDERGQRRVQWVLLTIALVGSVGALLEAVALIFDEVGLEPFRAPAVWLLAIAAAVGAGIAVSPPERADVTRVLRWVLELGALTLVAGVMWFGFAELSGARSPTQLEPGHAVAILASIGLVTASLHGPIRRAARLFVFGGPPADAGVIREYADAAGRAASALEVLELLTQTAVERVRVRWARAALELPGGIGTTPIAASGVALDRLDVTPALSVGLMQGSEPIGVFECGPGRDGSLTEGEREALGALARHAALGVVATRQHDLLVAQLEEIQRQADELVASRARLVHAQDVERRRIERDLHDGAQQQLVALIAKISLARNQLVRGSALTVETLEEAQEEARLALADLRRLVRGIHPSVLTDRGLVEALESLASRHVVSVEVKTATALRARRFDADVEGAAYFVVSEALANIAKYACADEVVISLDAANGRLDVAVVDNGIGFDADAVDSGGLENLRDRVWALGGSLRVESGDGRGTRVQASIPINAAGPSVG